MAIYIDEKTKFGQVVLSRLKELKKTQVWLADKVGLTKAYISQMCSDKNKRPSFEAVIKIAATLEIDPMVLAAAVLEDNKTRSDLIE